MGGQATFGYKWDGRQLIVDETEAPIRKELYEVFLKTKRKKATAAKLNELGYRTRNGSKFSDTTVGRLLRDPTPKGLHRANYTKSLGDKKHWKLKPQTEWIETPCDAIVNADLWNECNSILDQQEKKRTPKGPRTVHLLAGFLYCACGAKMYVYTEAPVYKCKKCRRKIDVLDIDEIYHEQLRSFLLTDADIESIIESNDTILKAKQELYKTTSNTYQSLKRQIGELVNLRTNGELQKQDFADLYKPIEEQVRQLEQQLPEIEAEIDFLKIQNLSTNEIVEEAKDLYKRWPKLPFEEKRSIVETITEKITIHQDSIDISLSYLPTPLSSTTAGKSQRNFMDS